MSEQLKLDYYYGIEADQFSFFRIPKILIRDKRFKKLSSDAVLLYSMMLDRMQLSRRNGWLDPMNRAYIYYTVEDAMEDLDRSRPTIIKVMKELDTVDGIGLIERRKPGQGKPAVIYVKNFATLEPDPNMDKNVDNKPEVKNIDFQKSNSFTSESKDSELQGVKNTDFKESSPFTSSGKESELQEVRNFASNNTDYSNTEYSHIEMNHTDQSYNERSDTSPVQSCQASDVDNSADDIPDHIDWHRPIKVTMAEPLQQRLGLHAEEDRRTDRDLYIEILKDQVEYDILIKQSPYSYQRETIDGILNIIADIATTTPKDGYERVNGRDYPHEVVKSRLLKMDYETITHVLDNFRKNTTQIRCMRSYLITALYNAKDEKEIIVTSQVNHDLYGGGMLAYGGAY